MSRADNIITLLGHKLSGTRFLVVVELPLCDILLKAGYSIPVNYPIRVYEEKETITLNIRPLKTLTEDTLHEHLKLLTAIDRYTLSVKKNTLAYFKNCLTAEERVMVLGGSTPIDMLPCKWNSAVRILPVTIKYLRLAQMYMVDIHRIDDASYPADDYAFYRRYDLTQFLHREFSLNEAPFSLLP